MRSTPATRQTKLLLLYGKLEDPDARSLVELSFSEHQDSARRDARLPTLYAELDLLKMILGQGALAPITVPDDPAGAGGLVFIDWREADVAEEGSQRAAIFQKLMMALEAQIGMLEKRAAANRGGRVGEITRKTPVITPDDRPYPSRVDPNEPAYRGDAVRRLPRSR